jgi:hypothetical protein
MQDHNESVQQLLIRLELLSKKQDQFAEEINDLRFQIKMLKASKSIDTVEELLEKKEPIIVSERISDIPKEAIKPEVFQPKVEVETPNRMPANRPKSSPGKTDLEKFIGENLLNKIGIIITVIGVSIGVKYSIEHELISPLMRIILGYLSGIALLGFGIKLKKKYENYSAVLVSGAIAIMYFITYSAHSFYGLIPQIPAFILMVVFTVFGVVTAIHYNRQVIAHIGLVGAYAVPFLLSSNSGNAAVLFSYMTIINIGILVISYKKYWKGLYGSSFGFTWLIYFSWYFSEYTTDRYFGLALLFLSIFFVIFYTIFLAYKVVKKEAYTGIDIVLLLLNTFFFYVLGYFILCCSCFFIQTKRDRQKFILLDNRICNCIYNDRNSCTTRRKLGDDFMGFSSSFIILDWTHKKSCDLRKTVLSITIVSLFKPDTRLVYTICSTI